MVVIDPDGAVTQPSGHSLRPARIRGPDGTGEAVDGVVRDRDRLVKAVRDAAGRVSLASLVSGLPRGVRDESAPGSDAASSAGLGRLGEDVAT